ncbi:sterol desaturase family protein [Erythrobacter rubeus]|uniref:Sterol desaturase family protein n=1 Tax=Erythrobacter rubeus TaxID=2760803 RepID=A0ABR8KRQ5_9SPHN|nr:sterol desaturase family protein [Erythrobacter rubeus]MBD2842107.1 sterol desaturase family protein [Erythrobacter rubeus]
MLEFVAILVAMFAVFAVFDAVLPARHLPEKKLWRTRGVIGFMLYYLIAFTAPFAWDGLLAQYTLLDGSALPLWAQVGGGYLLFNLFMYTWHRTMHGSDILWRHLHQMHHSAERVDIWSAYWFHPLDMTGWALLGSLVFVGVFGVSPEAAVIINLIGSFMAMFTHSNIRTPHWLGYFISRPEMHAVHHERGVHRYNYADLPYFDMLFGTYRNPRKAPEKAGIVDGGSDRIGDLLIGRSIG